MFAKNTIAFSRISYLMNVYLNAMYMYKMYGYMYLHMSICMYVE